MDELTSLQPSDRAAKGIAWAGWLATARERDTALFPNNFDASLKPEPSSPDQVSDMLGPLDRAARNRLTFGYEITSEADTSGDPQIGFDVQSTVAMYNVSESYGYLPFGEEDEFRRAGDDAPVLRAAAIRNALQNDLRFAVIDSIDGTHQCAAMGQPGAYCHAALLVAPRARPTAAICLGTGEMLSTDGDAVWLTRQTGLESISYQLSGDRLKTLRHYRTTWVIPAFKPERLAEAMDVINVAGTDRVKMIAPLGGNPGIMSSLLLGGSTAAYQPRSWAWDQIIAYMAALLDFPVMRPDTGTYLSPIEITNMFIKDLVEAHKTTSLIVGKTKADAEAVRDAVNLTVNRP